MRRLPERWPALSPRRHQILRLVASGLTTAEISRELVLSEQTVRNHIRDVLRELDAHSRLEAVDIARRLGLLESEPVELEPGG
jgi:DNA-binding NarL/FixJ family response regulator